MAKLRLVLISFAAMHRPTRSHPLCFRLFHLLRFELGVAYEYAGRWSYSDFPVCDSILLLSSSCVSGEVTVLKRSDSFLNNTELTSEIDYELTSYASAKLSVDRMPPVDTLAAPKLCSAR